MFTAFCIFDYHQKFKIMYIENPKCLNCKKDISDKRLGAKYCSTSCRVSYNNKQKRRLEKQALEERKALKKQLPDWLLYVIKRRYELLVILSLIIMLSLSLGANIKQFKYIKQSQTATEIEQPIATDEE